MSSMLSTHAAIEEFLSHKRIAFVGLSRQPEDFSRAVCKVLEENEFDVVPVNPGATEILGRHCYRKVDAIDQPVDGALIMTTPDRVLGVLEQCERAGVKRIWLHRGVGGGAVTDEAVAYCRDHGMAVVPGECPLMFVGNPPAGAHRAHAALKRFAGTYPEERPRKFNAALIYLGLIGWLLCGLAMYVSMALLPLTAALIVHAAVAPLVFALLARRYYRRRTAPEPIATAALFTTLVIALDFFVVALAIEQSLAMFTSPLGTWIPFLAIFLASWVAGNNAPSH